MMSMDSNGSHHSFQTLPVGARKPALPVPNCDIASPVGGRQSERTENPGSVSQRLAASEIQEALYLLCSRTKSTHCLISGTLWSQLYSYSMEMLPSKPCCFSSSRTLPMRPTPIP